MTTCPKCGFTQEGGNDCLRCGIVFHRYHNQMPAPAPAGTSRAAPSVFTRKPVAATAPAEDEPPPGLFRRFYRVFRWVMLATSLTVLVLILRQSPPPVIPDDPDAGRRADAKMMEMQQAAAAGASYTLQLDEAELNDWLHKNLDWDPPRGSSPSGEPGVDEVRSNMRDVRIQMEGDLLRAWVLFDFHGKNLSLLLEGRLHVQDQILRFEAISGRLGSLPIPRATLNRAVARAFDDPQNADKLRLPPDIRDVRIENGRIHVVRQ